MKTRKIWSIPIALALVLALAGATAMSVVQAQAPPTVPRDLSVVAEGKANTTILMYKVNNYAGADTDGTGPGEIESVVVEEVGTTPKGLFAAEFNKSNGSKTGAGQFDLIEVKIATDTPLDSDEYNIKITAIYDTDRERAAIDNPNTTKIFEDGGTEDKRDTDDVANDKDGQLVTDLKVYVPGVPKTPLDFHVDIKKVFQGENISAIGRDIDDKPQAFVIENLGHGTATIPPASDGTDSDGSESVKFVVDDGNKVILKATANGIDELNSATEVSLNETIQINPGDIDFDGKDEVFDLDEITATINKVDPLTFRKLGNATGSFIYTNTVLETAKKRQPVLAYDFEPKISSEEFEEFVTGSLSSPGAPAQASLFEVENKSRTIVYIGPDDGLKAGQSYSLTLTLNGDSGLRDRGVSGSVRITILGADRPPELPEDAEGKLPVVLKENVKGEGLVSNDTVVYDFTGFAKDPEGRRLTYSTSSNSGFKFDDTGTKLMVDGDIDDVGRGDNTATTDVREINYWPTSAPQDWGFASKTEDGSATTRYPDLTRDITVKVSDGSGSKDIAVTITLDMNEPVVKKTDDLPDNVKFVTETVDGKDDDGKDIKVTTETYEITKSVKSRDGGVTVIEVIDLAELVNDADGDELEYDGLMNVKGEGTNPTMLSDGKIVLTFVPSASGEWTFDISVDDGYNSYMNAEIKDADGKSQSPKEYFPDSNLTLKVALTVEPPPERETKPVKIVVTENTTVCNVENQDATLGDCTLAGVVTGEVDSYSTVNTADGGDNYAVDPKTGAVSVKAAPDFEKGEEPSFTIAVKNDYKEEIALIFVEVAIVDVNEAPAFDEASTTGVAPNIVQINPPTINVKENDQNDKLVAAFKATDPDSGATVTYSVTSDPEGAPFKIDANGNLKVDGNDVFNVNTKDSYSLTIQAADGKMTTDFKVEVTVENANDAPMFVEATKKLEITIDENTAKDTAIHTYTATDPDGDALTFSLRDSEDTNHFKIDSVTGVLSVAGTLDYETDESFTVEINVSDPHEAGAEIAVIVKLNNLNDNAPKFAVAALKNAQVQENTPRGTNLGVFTATDADGDAITYSLAGANAKAFQISGTGDLMTLASLDYDGKVPCTNNNVCAVDVVATDTADKDGKINTAKHSVTITVTSADDSISTLRVSKANPVPGASQGDANTALADTKTTVAGQDVVKERPAGLPATGTADQDKTVRFVETSWANWGTVLRLEVTAESPDPNCDGGNRCVVVKVEGDSSDDILNLRAYRSATQENRFVTAVMPVSGEGAMTETPGDASVYAHSDGSVARLKVDEEDKIKIEFDNLRGSVNIENEAPEIDNFLPEHEAATDDADVDYTFTVTDDISGIPDPEDLPNDADDEYISVVAMVNNKQCSTDPEDKFGPEVKGLNLSEGVKIYCPGSPKIREIIDDNDFDDVDNGFDVETTVVLGEGKYYVTFIVCDKAGNCAAYDPEQTKHKETLPEIIVDTVDPEFVEARTGVKWNNTDNEYDDDRSFIQVVFKEDTPLNNDTIEKEDFVVAGHTVKNVHWYDPDDEDTRWGDDDEKTVPTRWGKNALYQEIDKTVFLELEDELAPDETPDVALVPNGIEDSAGNEQDDGEEEADDWISPKFVVVSIVSPRETPDDEVLAGEDDQVVITLTADERIKQTRPDILVHHVNAPEVATTDGLKCDDGTGKDSNGDYRGKRERGEVIVNDKCKNASAVKGGQLSVTIEKISNTEWIATVEGPEATGYYNFYVSATDRSSQNNPGSEGVDPEELVTAFFKKNGDIETDDAIFFEGDIKLDDPSVRVSGIAVDDNEPTVELRTPLFVEFDFSSAEGAEYAEDTFDWVQITKFELNGVDMTDSVKTTDDETFLVALDSISAAEHEIVVQAVDRAGNVLDDELEINFEVETRDPFEKRLNPGWNLVSLPGEPADSSVASVFGSGIEVKTVYTYDPVVPGGWMVAVRETLTSEWQGDLTHITAKRGYWVLSDAIQDWEVSIPRMAGGAADSGTPIQPPVIPMYAGWNLIPVIDVTGNILGTGKGINAATYLDSLDDGLDLARVLSFDTIKNEWSTLNLSDKVNIGSGYWVFVRESASLVPGGTAN